MLAQLYANVRQAARRAFASGATQGGDLNVGGDFLVAQGLPERAELVRLGGSYSAQLKEGNAFTVLITIPTTLAGFSLQNGEAAGGKSYIIDRCWAKCVTSTAAANYLALLGQLVTPGTALVADSANKTITGMSGQSAYGGKAQIAIASVVTGCLGDKWQVLAGSSTPTSTSIAAAVDTGILYGRFVVPPLGSFNLSLQEAVSGGTAIYGFDWHEVQLA